MGLITEEVEMELGPNIQYFEEKGYVIPRRLDQFGRFTVPKGTKIKVKTKDLSNNCNIAVETQCDNPDCRKVTTNPWNSYLLQRKENGETYCFKCGKMLYGSENTRKTKLLSGVSFEQKCIEVGLYSALDLWDYDLNIFKGNKISPSDISHYSSIKCYFKCPKGIHESELKDVGSLTSKTNKTNLYCKQCVSLLFVYPDSIDFLSEKNDKNIINEISYGSRKELWWICDNGKHDDYLRSVKLSTKAQFRCPMCVLERNESFLQEKVRTYLFDIATEFDFKLSHENYCNLMCDSFKGWKLFYDNELISSEFNLVIEVHGIQHYLINGWHRSLSRKNNTTPEEELEYIQQKDKYKENFALENGYYYLAIPYTADDTDNTWKIMIDDMLNYIYEQNN